MPAACSIAFILAASSSMTIQQSAPLALVVPLTIALTFANAAMPAINRKDIVKWLSVAASLIILWGNAYATSRDEEAMRKGTNAAASIAESITHTLIEEKLYQNPDYTFFIYGSPAKNIMFFKDGLYENANYHAKFGNFTWGTVNNLRSWKGIFHNLLGVNLPTCTNELADQIAASDELKSMPAYPLEGSIIVMGDVVVIKVSE